MINNEWYMESGGFKNGYFTRNIFISPNKINSVRENFNNRDCYTSIYMYNNKDINKSLLYGPMYIDLDIDLKTEEDYNKIKIDLNIAINSLNVLYKIDTKHLRIYFSGNKGFHIVIHPKVFGIEPCLKLNEHYKLIANEINKLTEYKLIDMKIYDKRRLIRLVGTINNKTGLYKVPISLEDINSFNLKELFRYAEEPREIEFKEIQANENTKTIFKTLIEDKPKKVKGKTKFKINNKKKIPNLPCVKYIIDNGVSAGNRNNTSVALASCLLQNGFEIKECTNMLNEWNKVKNDPPLSEMEIIATANSAYKLLLSNKIFGCASFKALDICNEKNCKIKKGI